MNAMANTERENNLKVFSFTDHEFLLAAFL